MNDRGLLRSPKSRQWLFTLLHLIAYRARSVEWSSFEANSSFISCVCQEINIKPVWKSNPRGRKQHKASRVEFWALSSSSLLFAFRPILVDPVHAVKVDRVYMREMALFHHEQRVTWWIIKRSNQIFMMFLFSRLARSVCLFIFMNWTLFIGDISIDRSSH